MRRKAIGIGAGILAASLAILITCIELNRVRSLRKARRTTLRLGMQGSPPWYGLKGNVPEGPALDIATEAARRAGLPILWVNDERGPEKALYERTADIWPLAGIVPHRQRAMRFTEPWLELPYWLVFVPSSRSRLEDQGTGLLLAVRGNGLTFQLAHNLFPQARIQSIPTNEAVLRRVCSGEFPAALIPESYVIGAGSTMPATDCADRGIALTSRPALNVGFGLATRLDDETASAAAEAIRTQIGAMVADGSLTAIMLRWGVSSSEIRTLEAAAEARKAVLSLTFAVVLLAAAAGVLLWSLLRLRRAKQRLQYQSQLLSQSRDAILAVDLSGRLTYLNPAALRILSQPDGAVLGRPAAEVLPDQVHSALQLAQPGESGRQRIAEIEIRQEHREPAYWLASASGILTAGGRTSGSVLFLRDITDTRRMETWAQQSQRLESLGRLAGGVAHDFNNLLTVISGNCELLLHGMSPGHEAEAPLQSILKASSSATQLTRQLLAFSRGQLLETTVLDLNEAVRENAELLGRLLDPSIHLRLNLSVTALPLRADAAKLSQIVMNLALNARDAMPHGGLLELSTGRRSVVHETECRRLGVTLGEYAWLEVRDNGVGMDESTMKHIFEPFFTTKAKGRGTGLGLATVYGVVHQSGGGVAVLSEETKGTTFTVLLPISDAAKPASELMEETVLLLSGTAGRRILVTDDQPEVRSFVVSVLREAGYVVEEAEGYSGALQSWSDSSFDLLISDVVMPERSGHELAAAIRQVSPAAKILLMSGYTNHANSAEVLTASGASFLQKPFSPTALLQTVRALLGG
ncbi:response regulator [Paludibaculum fermentans]|uniref:response regulator n=1 Tax=Paludibaculum fermentans TaxID=1473598 RepID=UPI003EBF5162